MGTKACNIFFQEDVEDYYDDPITLLDFGVSENCLRNVTIEDPGYIVSISSEDYKERLRKSLSQLKELKKPSQSSEYANKYDYLLYKCRICTIKLVDCNKYPWYHRNKLGSKNKTQNSLIEHNIIEIKEENNEKKIMIIDLIEKEYVECNKQYENTIREKEKERIGKVRKQTPTRFFKSVLNIQNKSNSEVPRSEAEKDSDLIFSTYSRLIDKAVNKLKSNLESGPNNTSLNRNLGKLLLGSKSFEEIGKDINNNESKKAHHKKNNTKHCNKIKTMYRSEQISKTKLKITKSLPKEMISSKNYHMEDKEYNPNLKAKNREEYDSLKRTEKQHNSFTNENKQENIQSNSYSFPLPPCPVIKTFASLPNQRIGPERIRECNKQLFSGERIIPHYHKNTSLNLLNILSKTKSNTKCPKRSKESIHNYETKRHKNGFIDDLNIGPLAPLVSQIPNPSIHQTIHAIGTNNAKVNINKLVQKNNNTKEDLSNFSEAQSVNPSQATYKPPANNDMILHRSQVTQSPDVIIENVNKSVVMRQSETYFAQFEEERQRYLLPSNYNLTDPHIHDIFSYYAGSNISITSYT